MRYVNLVREFNTAMGCGARESPGLPTDNQRIVRVQLMLEELGEVTEAMAARDLLRTLCELLDFQYVVDGGFVMYGSDRAGFQIPGWETRAAGPPSLMNTVDASMVHLTSLTRGIAEVSAVMIGGGDWRVVSTAVLELRGMLANLWSALRVPEELRWAMFQELHAANMAKSGGGLNEAGRVVKPEGWRPADQSAVLAAHGYMIEDGASYALMILGDATC